jgi:prolipoprotein diacylglyceryltransferase
MLWNLVGVLLLIWVARRWRMRPPALFSLYVAWYTFGRFFEEQLRIDPSNEFWGMRVNAWVSLVLFVASVLFFVWWQIIRGRRDRGRGVGREPRRPEPRTQMAVPRGRVRSRR